MERFQLFSILRYLVGFLPLLASSQVWAGGTLVHLTEAKAAPEVRAEAPPTKPINKKTNISFFAMGYYRGLNTVAQSEEPGAPVDRLETAGLLMAGNLNHKFHPTLGVNLKLVTILENGSSRSLVNENRAPISGLFVDNLDVTWRPVNILGLRAGALNQEFLEAPLLVKDDPFPGLQQILFLGPDSGAFQAKLISQQVVPASRTMGSLNEKDESFARLYTQTANAQLKLNRFRSKVRVTHFEWNDLTTFAATQGRIRGNSTTSDPAPGTRLLYQYRGWETGGEGHLRLYRSLEVGGGGSYLVNNAAPEGQNAGRILFGEIQGRITRGVELNLRGESFINQADSSPAAYNGASLPKDFGHNNREGMMGQFTTRFLKEDFAIRTFYLESRVLDPNPFQQDDRILFFSLETKYDIL